MKIDSTLQKIRVVIRKCLLLLIVLLYTQLHAQLLEKQKKYTLADTLRGSMRIERSCYDVQYYTLSVDFDIVNKKIKGSNIISFKGVSASDKIQIDLFENLNINSISFGNQALQYERKYNAVFVKLPFVIEKEKNYEIAVSYEGEMLIAKNPPWDGGFSFSKDKNNLPIVGVSCEGLGASSWWPCKDHLSDEPDSGMTMRYTIPDGLQCIGNGYLAGESVVGKKRTFEWKVSYPINSYNVTFYIGDYSTIHDTYTAKDGDTLSLDYYVLPYNIEKAKKQFEQVKPMLHCYEKYLGKYPFWKDGYSLVETNYLGMEHQSAIAYGNRYLKGYAGHDFSRIGLDFDYIIIHETGHEWWGNSVSCKDIADMWIHESFCTYTEAIYVECMFGKIRALDYINAKKVTIGNKAPIQGIYGVNEEGDGDMYNKGMLMLNTFRTIFNNDTKWWSTIKNMCDTTFKYENIDAKDVITFFSEKYGSDLTPIFNEYLSYAKIPTLEYKLKKQKDGTHFTLNFNWKLNKNNDFAVMPIVYHADGFEHYIYPAKDSSIKKTKKGYQTTIELRDATTFQIADDLMYINVVKK